MLPTTSTRSPTSQAGILKVVEELYKKIANEVFGTTKFTTKGHTYDLSDEWKRIEYVDEVKRVTGIDVLNASEDEMKANPTCPNLTEIDSISSFDGVVVYECLAQNKDEEKYLIGTKQFSMAARVSQNDRVSFEFNGALEDRIFICDENQKGVIALVPRLNRSENYPYSVVKVAKVNQ